MAAAHPAKMKQHLSVSASAAAPLYPPTLSMKMPPHTTPRTGAVAEVAAKAARTVEYGALMQRIRYSVDQNWMPVTTKKSADSASVQ